MLKSFLADKAGNYAITMAALTVPLILGIGFGVDYSRLLSARSHLQELTDGTSLALAISREKDDGKLRAQAADFIAGNVHSSAFDKVEIVSLNSADEAIDLALKGKVDTLFMGLANINTFDVQASALAKRAVTGSVEVALVLDNTWSMSETDVKGVSKVATLKKAATSLATSLMSNKDAVVRVALVPYADYVNVGTANRKASWLAIPEEYDVKAVAATCKTESVTSTPCDQKAPKYSCTKYVDGVPETTTCGGECTKWGTPVTKDEKVCSGGVSAASYKWHGCVGSRMSGTTRLNDGTPGTKYPGYVETSQKCLNPIVPLTNDKGTVLTAIDGMKINIGSYKPYTYIPSGLIWGQNVLSSSEPFAEAADYDAANVKPRKVMVLMTDGDNTLQFRASDGRHVGLNADATKAATQVAKTNADSAAICAYMKTKNIEIFTVAFMVDNADAKTLLEGCASDAAHFYDASDPDKLLTAFSGIAQSLSQVRLAR